MLTTEFSPVGGHELTPLYQIDRTRFFPVSCTPNVTLGCNRENRDFALITTETHVNAAIAAGYLYGGIQGYVYTTRAPGTEALRTQCNTVQDDCAVFLESHRSAFEAAGYIGLMPGMASGIIGYAYPPGDDDSDGLPNALERVVGTSLTSSDSDGDGIADGVEYPMVGLPVSDPCTGTTAACTADTLYRNGFE